MSSHGYGKGNALSQLGKYQEALIWYDKALAIDPKHVRALNGKGNALSQLGKYEEAITWHDKALSIDPQHIENLAGKANSLIT